MKRRAWLRQCRDLAGALPLAWLSPALPILGLSASACATAPDPRTAVLELALEEIPDGGRMAARVALHPVEIRRNDREVTVVSLLCTHQGCKVRWFPSQNTYLCPCHDGAFDADGRPIAGPPVQPLDRVPVVIEGERVRIGPILPPEQAA